MSDQKNFNVIIILSSSIQLKVYLEEEEKQSLLNQYEAYQDQNSKENNCVVNLKNKVVGEDGFCNLHVDLSDVSAILSNV